MHYIYFYVEMFHANKAKLILLKKSEIICFVHKINYK